MWHAHCPCHLVADVPGLARVWVIAKERARLGEKLEATCVCSMSPEEGKVIGVPWLHDLGAFVLEDLDKRDKGNAVQDHQKRVAMHDAFAACEEVKVTCAIPDHKECSVLVAVEGKTTSLGLLVAEGP